MTARFARAEGGASPHRTAMWRRQIGPDEPRATFLGRLWALFGAPAIIDEGFRVAIDDRRTGVRFEAASGASGPRYVADTSPETLASIVRDFETLLARTPPAECALVVSVAIEHGGGQVTIGVRDGRSFEEVVRRDEDDPQRAASLDECVAIATRRGAGYGIEAGFHVCLDEVLPPVPASFVVDGRVYANCIGFVLALESTGEPGFAFDEGRGIEELPIARVPLVLTPDARRWLAAHADWRATHGEKRRDNDR